LLYWRTVCKINGEERALKPHCHADVCSSYVIKQTRNVSHSSLASSFISTNCIFNDCKRTIQISSLGGLHLREFTHLSLQLHVFYSTFFTFCLTGIPGLPHRNILWRILAATTRLLFEALVDSGHPPQEELLTPSRNELLRLVKAMNEWEQNPTGIFSDEQRAAIAVAAPRLGEEVGDLLLRLATEVQRVAGGGRAADVQNAVLDQLAKLREEVAAREQEERADGAGCGSRPGANTAEAQVTVPASSRQTRQSGSLQKQLEDAKLALDESIQHAVLADDQNLAACEAALQRLLAAWGNRREVLRGVAEAEKLAQKRQKQQEEQEAAKVCPANSRLEAAVTALKEKLQRSRHLAAQQAVTRALGDVDEVIEAGDPAEIGDLHKQLQEQRETLTATAVELGDEQLNAITELHITVDKSLRRLNRKRRELVRGTNDGSLFSPAPSEEGDGGGDNVLPIRFELPSAEEQNVTTAEAGLSSSQFSNF
jgi:hypothetical protein